VIAAIDGDGNVVAPLTFEQSVNQAKFLRWLQLLRESCGEDELYLFLDNLGVHHAKSVK
jgi:hypothetical protein